MKNRKKSQIALAITVLILFSCLQFFSVLGADYCWRSAWGVLPDQVDPSMEYHRNPTNLMPLLTADGLLLHTDSSQDPKGYTQAMFYIQTELAMPSQLAIEADFRFVSGFTSPDYKGRAEFYIVFNTAPNVGGVLCIRQDVVF